uniref:Uncharacterized protein n=1 Tax=Arundo donax TaxID=35708 RepID=A0A0A9CXC9_ARUDO
MTYCTTYLPNAYHLEHFPMSFHYHYCGALLSFFLLENKASESDVGGSEVEPKVVTKSEEPEQQGEEESVFGYF